MAENVLAQQRPQPNALSAPFPPRRPTRASLPEHLINAIISQESGGNPRAFNGLDSGLMQINAKIARAGAGYNTPLLAADADEFDPATNVAHGTAYITGLLESFGDLDLALAAYNWGPGKVREMLAGTGEDMPAETKQYIADIHAMMRGEVSSTGKVLYPGDVTSPNAFQNSAPMYSPMPPSTRTASHQGLIIGSMD